VEDLLGNPGRRQRPERIVVIIRGAPGAGKTHVSKLIKVSRLFQSQRNSFNNALIVIFCVSFMPYIDRTPTFFDKEMTN
jgi:DNA helicase IV